MLRCRMRAAALAGIMCEIGSFQILLIMRAPVHFSMQIPTQ
jgi:hypothetical protein